MLKERRLEDGIKVTTRYKDLADESYETEWTLHPLLLESDHRIERPKDMNDLVNVAEEISGAGAVRDGRQKAANGGEGAVGRRNRRRLTGVMYGTSIESRRAAAPRKRRVPVE